VIVGDLNIVGVAVPPHEAHPELIIDANAVLALSVTAEFFQPIAGRNSQILQAKARMQRGQFPLSDISQIRRRHPLALACVPKLFRVPVRERLDHCSQFNE